MYLCVVPQRHLSGQMYILSYLTVSFYNCFIFFISKTCNISLFYALSRLEVKIRQLIIESKNKYRLAGVVVLGKRDENTRPGFIWLYNRHLHRRFIEEFNGIYLNESPLQLRFNSESSIPFAIQHNYSLSDDYSELEQEFNETLIDLDEKQESFHSYTL